jgi:hypothetical protein
MAPPAGNGHSGMPVPACGGFGSALLVQECEAPGPARRFGSASSCRTARHRHPLTRYTATSRATSAYSSIWSKFM